MTDLFLGIIAVAVVVMAAIQVAAIVYAARAARSLGDAVSRLEHDVRPIMATLQQISADTARVTASAATQLERTQQTVDTLLQRLEAVGQRVEDTVQSVQDAVLAPAREGFAFLQAIRSVLAAVWSAPSRRGPRSRHAATEDEDALFIG